MNRVKKNTKFYLAIVTALVISAGLISCTLPKTQPLNTAGIIKSENDQRQYKFVVLPNKLKVLLISDVNSDKAAASLDVYVGSRQDPHNTQGLAHFLEHMLFLGTQKYPEAGEYQQFINNHNGSHNAYTSFEHTNYFFDVGPGHLNEALDRFSQFFIAPLFTPAYVEREKNAVHSEYMAKIKNDARKSLDVFKEVINQKHPFSKFSVGNLDTLANTDESASSLQHQLVDFYKEHYSANIMTLVVLGRESLSELETMVNTKFIGIRNTEKTIDVIKEPLFVDAALPLQITIKPEKEQRILSMAFATEDQAGYYRQKPLQYIGNILGHEGQGSLLSYLKLNGLAESLSAGSGFTYKGGGNFVIVIALTEKGLAQKDVVIDSVFQTINRIKDAGAQRWLFDEQRSMSQQRFRYLESSAAMSYVSSVAANLHYYPTADVLSGPYLMVDFDAKMIDRFLGYLSPKNTVLTLSAPEVEVNSSSHFYNTPYQSTPVSSQTLAHWNSLSLNPQIVLPKPNEFITDNFQLTTSNTTTDKPQLILNQKNLKLWFQHDDDFEVPKASVLLDVRSGVAADSVVHSALLVMFTQMVEDELNEYSYPAMLAGLNYAITPKEQGFAIKITGFNDKLPLLLNKVLDAVSSPKFDTLRFNDIKQDNIRRLENTHKQQPYTLLMRQLSELLYRNKWSDQQLLQAVQTISLPQLRSYSAQLLSAVDVRVLMYGNLQEKQVKQMGKKVSKILLKNSSPVASVDIAKLTETELTQGIESDYSDAALLFYLQSASIDKSERAAMGVVAHWLRSDFYTQLRTEKQLGYIVMAGAYPVMDVPGIIFMAQSPVAGPTVLQKEMKQFLQQKRQLIDTLPESEFDQHKRALVQRLSESPKNLWEQSERYWQEIEHGYFLFDSREQLIQAIQTLSFEQWKTFFRQQITGSKRRGLWLHSTGKFIDHALPNAKAIGDVDQFKAKADYYPFP